MWEDKDKLGKSLLSYAMLAVPLAIATRKFPSAVALSSMQNFLAGFYKKGVGQMGKGARFLKEGAKSQLELAGRQAFSPGRSWAQRVTGISARTHRKIKRNLDAIDVLRAELATGVRSKTEVSKLIQHARKEIHAKLTNDYANQIMITNRKFLPSHPLAQYVERTGTRAKMPHVAKLSHKDAKALYGDKQLRHMLDLQDVPLEGTQLLMYSETPIQGVLRGIQFDRPVYNWFKRINKLQKTGKVNAESVRDELVEMGLEPRVIDGKITFNLSPARKSNYDWGGYRGVVQWDPTKPSKVKFMATDKRDIFMFKAGKKPVVNVSQTKEIEIPQVMKEMREIGYRGELDDWLDMDKALKKAAKTKSAMKELEPVKMRDIMAKGDRENLDNLLSSYDDAMKNVPDWYLEKEFIPIRAIAGAGLLAGATGAGVMASRYLDDE